MENLYIAVDYDDTITTKVPYPQKADLDIKAKKYLQKIYELGYTLVLWSARKPEYYEEAYTRCINEFHIPIIHIRNFDKEESRKINCLFYIDDRSYVNRKVPWKKIYKYLKKRIVYQ